MPDTTTIYITKGAETHGVRKTQAMIFAGGKAADVVDAAGRVGRSYWHTEFKLSEAEAIADAEARRTKRIASLKKQIAAIEAIDLTKVREG